MGTDLGRDSVGVVEGREEEHAEKAIGGLRMIGYEGAAGDGNEDDSDAEFFKGLKYSSISAELCTECRLRID